MRDTYQECVNEFVSRILEQFSDDIVAMILHGGVVRESAPIKHWSDKKWTLISNQKYVL